MPLIINRQQSNDLYRRAPKNHAPEFLTRLSAVEVTRGYSIRLTVIIVGYPEPDVTWTLDGEEICENDHFFFDWNDDENSHTLNIIGITKREEGVYRCVAQNGLGITSTMGFVSVKDSRKKRKKKISRTPKISTILEWKTPEEAEEEDTDEKDTYLQRHQHTWDWWNREALSDNEGDTCPRGMENELPGKISKLAEENLREGETYRAKNSPEPLTTASNTHNLPLHDGCLNVEKAEQNGSSLPLSRHVRASSEPRTVSGAMYSMKSTKQKKNMFYKPKELKAIKLENKYRKVKSFWENLSSK